MILRNPFTKQNQKSVMARPTFAGFSECLALATARSKQSADMVAIFEVTPPEIVANRVTLAGDGFTVPLPCDSIGYAIRPIKDASTIGHYDVIAVLFNGKRIK